MRVTNIKKNLREMFKTKMIPNKNDERLGVFQIGIF